ncbi:MAG: hypothetical protein ACP5VE_15560 [Chthonomonadales bacterium]
MSEASAKEFAALGSGQRESAERQAGTRRAMLQVAVSLFVAMALTYIFTMEGRTGSDGYYPYETARSLYDHGWYDLLPGTDTAGTVAGLGGKHYSIYGPLQPLVSVPLYALGAFLAAMTRRDPGMVTQAAVSLLNPLATALLVALVFLYVAALGARVRTAALVAIILAFASPLWVNSRQYMSEPLFTLLFFGAFLAARAVGKRPNPMAPAVLSGVLAGLMTGQRENGIVLVPLIGLYAAAAAAANSDGGSRKTQVWQAVVGFSAGAILLLGAVAYLNWARFGSPLKTGYHEACPTFSSCFQLSTLPEGISGLLFSPGRGLFWFWPLAFVAAAGWRRFHRVHPFDSWFILASFLAMLFLFGGWFSWMGGTFRGPRFLLPITPWLAATLYPLIEDPGAAGKWGRRAIAVLAGYGLALQLLQVVLAPIQVNVDWRERHLPELTPQQALADTRDVWSWETFPLYAEVQSFRLCLAHRSDPSSDDPSHYPHKFDLWFQNAARKGVSTKALALLALAVITAAGWAWMRFAKALASATAPAEHSALHSAPPP